MNTALSVNELLSSELRFRYVDGSSFSPAGVARIYAAVAGIEADFLRSSGRHVRDSGVWMAEFRLSGMDPRRGSLANRCFHCDRTALRIFCRYFISARPITVTRLRIFPCSIDMLLFLLQSTGCDCYGTVVFWPRAQ
jgi:hypothetical protein